LLAATAPELLATWLQAVASPGTAAALQILCGGALVNCLSQVFFLQVQSLGRTKAIATVHLAQLPAYLLLLWFAAQQYGLVGVAIAWSLRTAADAILFCGMAASTVGAAARARLWRTLLATLAFGVALAGLSQIASLLARCLVLAVPLGALLVGAQRLLPLVKSAVRDALARRGTSQ
jgi:O-antigen/teichoic acid export membrane protein